MKYYLKEDMKKHTSFKIGGPCDAFVTPESIDELVDIVKFMRARNVKIYIVGFGTNLLVSDKGIRGLVINLGPSRLGTNDVVKKLNKIKIVKNDMIVEAGCLMVEVADEAANNGLAGFEPLCGIPGTIGGAIAMNAGAYNREIGDLVKEVEVINQNSELIKLSKKDLQFSYRHSIIKDKKYIVTRVTLELKKEENIDLIRENMDNVRALRAKRQPLLDDYPSAGSTFKRPINGYASELISECKLQGEHVGDAEVSTIHSGFIVNKKNAKASDVLKLIKKVKDKVNIYFNVDLKPEIEFLGFKDSELNGIV